MAVFLALVLGSIAAGIVGWLGVGYVDDWPASIAVGLAVMFVMTGVAHFAPVDAARHDRDRAARPARAGTAG